MDYEKLKEGWVEFIRYYCKEGYIDLWMGDCINNPNNPEKSMWQLSAFASYYRFDSGTWINIHDFDYSRLSSMIRTGEIGDMTSKQVYDSIFSPQ